MSLKTKNKSAKMNTHSQYCTIDPNMPDYNNDPTFVKRVNEMTALLDEAGLPEGFGLWIHSKTKKPVYPKLH